MKLLSPSTFSGGSLASSAELITLRNRNGLVAQFTNYGARWVSMWTPDRNGNLSDVILGFDTIDGYLSAGEKYHGAIVGRVCGRISNARFRIGEQEYLLASNDVYGTPVRNHLHGGIDAFHNRYWKFRTYISSSGEEAVEFTNNSQSGEEGYPGNLQVKVTYLLKDDNTLRMECEAMTDYPTPVNLTNHAFFNLQSSSDPAERKNVLSHTLTLNASAIIECDGELIPTGRLLPVNGTLLDFRLPHSIASSLLEEHSQIQKNKGFSLAYALDTLDTKEVDRLNFAARLSDDLSGRMLEIYTNQLSVQVYNGYFMDGTDIGKNKTPYYASAGIAIETQGYPDAPNQPAFPSILIDKTEKYYHITEYRFLSN
ncbi:aldose epimerase family protein [Parabacteroides sp.]